MNILHITWGSPAHLWLLPLVVVMLAILIYKVVRWRTAVRTLAGSVHTRQLLHHASCAKYILKASLLAVALVFLFIALLQPQWNTKEIAVAQEGRDLFIALDISRSMLAQDCVPNRLVCAKQKIKELVKHLSYERIGLILFSGSSFVQCPLTADYAAFFMFLDQIDVETISSGSTALEGAITQALRAFKTGAQRKNKLLLIFTDGEDFSSNLASVKEEAANAGMKIFAVGVGTAQGAPIPLLDAQGKQIGHQKDAQNAVVISRLNEGILKSVTSECGGMYVPMSLDDTDIQRIVKQVQRFEKEKFDDKKMNIMQEQYPYFVAVSFGCLAIEWLL
jgi:Ca-activated chloride channel family protein